MKSYMAPELITEFGFRTAYEGTAKCSAYILVLLTGATYDTWQVMATSRMPCQLPGST